MHPVHIVLVEDEVLLRASLQQLLIETGYAVSCFSSGKGLIDLLNEKAERTRPWSLVIMDVHLDGDNGLAVQRAARELGCTTPFIFMSAQQNARDVNQAWRDGAHNFLFKPFTPDELLHAIDDALRTDAVISPSLENATEPATLKKFQQLTPRQKEVLKLVAKGLSNTQISAVLSISARTVKMHRESMMHRYGFKHVTELVRFHDACRALFEQESPTGN